MVDTSSKVPKKPKKAAKSKKSKKPVKTWTCPRCKHKQKRRGKNEHSVRCTQCGKFQFARKYPDARLKANQHAIQIAARDAKLKQAKKPKKPKKQKKQKKTLPSFDPVTQDERVQEAKELEQPDYSKIEQTEPI